MTLTPPLFAKLSIYLNLVSQYFKISRYWFSKTSRDSTSSVNNMNISILIVRGFIKIIPQWENKLFQSRTALPTFYFKVRQALFKVGQRQVFQREPIFIWKWNKSYFKVEQNFMSKGGIYFKVGQLFQSGAYHSN